jgi:FAD/FMN-containing dehydrogenase
MGIRKKLADILGNDRVYDAPEILNAYRADYSLSSPGTPTCVIYPENNKEIQAVVDAANERATPIVPCSSRVHFHGTTIPKQGGIVLDLKNMNRVWDLDERNRKITVEAGVTWKQLYPILAEKHLMVCPPLLPHGDRSVVTTFLEREPLVIPLYEYGEPMMSMEVVWPNGTLFRTGSASAPTFPKSFAEGVNPQGPGVIDFYRLLQGAQGTMGIVTWAILKTEYLSPSSRLFFIPSDRLDDVIRPLYTIQRRKIGHECFLMNKLDMALILSETYPVDFKMGMDRLPAWTTVLALRGGRRRPEEKLQYEEKALREVSKEFYGLQLLEALPGIPHSAIRLADILRTSWPDEKLYWKHRYLGSCQDLIFITKLSKVPGFVSTMTNLAVQLDFPLDRIGIYVQPVENARSCHVEFNLFYSPGDPKEKAKVSILHDEAAKAILNQGAVFTRPYGSLAKLMYERASPYTAMLRKVKNIFDPNNIMCPGNLCF